MTAWMLTAWLECQRQTRFFQRLDPILLSNVKDEIGLLEDKSQSFKLPRGRRCRRSDENKRLECHPKNGWENDHRELETSFEFSPCEVR